MRLLQGLLLFLTLCAPAAAEDRRLNRSGYVSVTLEPVLQESNLWQSAYAASLDQLFQTRTADFAADLAESLEKTVFRGRLRVLPGYRLKEQAAFREAGERDTFLVTVDLRSRYGLSAGSTFAACLSGASCLLLSPFDLFTYKARTEATVGAFYFAPDGRRVRLTQRRYKSSGSVSGDFFEANDLPRELEWIGQLTDRALADLKGKALAELPAELVQRSWAEAAQELARPPAGGPDALGLPPEPRLAPRPPPEPAAGSQAARANPHELLIPGLPREEKAGHPEVAELPRQAQPGPAAGPPPEAGQPLGLEAMVRQVGRSVFKVRTSEGTGSGFVFSRRGYGFTAMHVVEGASSITIRFHNGREMPARLLMAEPRLDLAVLAFAPSEEIVPLPLGDSDPIVAGDPIVAIGYPLDLGLSVVPGTISAIIPHVHGPLFQIDTLLQPGSSGGPLLNARGEGIGITFRGTVGSSRGYTYAVSSEAARQMFGHLMAEP
jgi:hypothetical protein